MPSHHATHVYQPPAHTGLDLIHVDGALLVINKPSGLLSVPGRGEEKHDSLIARVQLEFPDALIVHRLDMETSGLLVLARSKEMHRRLSILFQNRKVDKRYVAIVEGMLQPARGKVDLPINVDWPNRPLHRVDHEAGKPALTRYRVLSHDAATGGSRVELEPETGRTHQLRVHMQALGHPILGDGLYAPPTALAKAERLLLHAETLSFRHPVTDETLRFHCPAPF